VKSMLFPICMVAIACFSNVQFMQESSHTIQILITKLFIILYELSSICYSSLMFWLLYTAILTRTATISWVLLPVQHNFQWHSLITVVGLYSSS
jgi:hypothetical protein